MKRYQTQVSDWMQQEPITIKPTASLAEAYNLMLENGIRRLIVMGREFLGIVTLSDVLRLLPAPVEEADTETKLLMTTRKVEDVMTYDPVTVDPEDTVQEAAERMLEYQVSGLPVLLGSEPVGIITESDIFRLVVESWSQETSS